MDKTIVAFLIGSFTTLLGVIAAEVFSERRDRRKEFNQAAERFVFAFQDELSRLRYDSASTFNIIKPALLNHQSAYYIFGRYLSGQELENFKVAWRHYYVITPPYQDKPEDKEPLTEADRKTREDERTALIEGIERLLEFAKFR